MTGKIIPIIFCLMFICSCGRKQENAITFSVGGAPRELEFWETLVKQFETESGIKVEIMRQPTDTDQRRQGLVIPLKSKKKNPDVFLMDVAWIAQFAASGWLEELGAYVEKDKLDTGVFFKRVLDLADNYDGKLVALPVYVDGGLLYYRKDLLKKHGYNQPPQTWQQLVDYSLAIQKAERESNAGFYGFVWQGAQYEGLICDFLEFAASGGGGIAFKKEGGGARIILDTPPNRKAVQFMQDLIRKYQVSPPNTFTEMKEEEVRTFFEQGNALFERNWPYAWALHIAEDSPVRDKTGIAPLPHFENGESVSTLGGWHIGISRYSGAKEESFKFLKFIVSRNTQKDLALALGWNPARRDVYRDKEVAEKLPHFAALSKIFENARPRPNVPYYTLISEIFQRNINAALSGKTSPETALSLAQKEAQEIVDRYEQK